jgi:hypothetical protein
VHRTIPRTTKHNHDYSGILNHLKRRAHRTSTKENADQSWKFSNPIACFVISVKTTSRSPAVPSDSNRIVDFKRSIGMTRALLSVSPLEFSRVGPRQHVGGCCFARARATLLCRPLSSALRPGALVRTEQSQRQQSQTVTSITASKAGPRRRECIRAPADDSAPPFESGAPAILKSRR